MPKPAKRLVVTSDDFGLSTQVNEAVERAHRDGILTAASLMVSAPGAADAVARARAMPSLRVGLHLVMVEAWPTLPAADLPDLVDAAGLIRADQGRLGLDLALKRSARHQLAAEIRAQFEAFRATGLPLDHVNAHKHFHIHPIIAGMVLAIGAITGCGRSGCRGNRARPCAAPSPAPIRASPSTRRPGRPCCAPGPGAPVCSPPTACSASPGRAP